MDLRATVEQFVNNLFSDEANDEPSDKVEVEEAEMKLPEWFDEQKYNQGRRFFWDNLFGFSTSFIFALITAFAVPSILVILLSTRRSNSTYTAYKRYRSSFLHIYGWLNSDLKPGTKTWKSIHSVRTRHIKTSKAAKLKNIGKVSQRDLSLVLFAGLGYASLRPDKFGIRQFQEGDWEAINHYWRVIGHMVGLHDRYNIYQPTFQESRQVFKLVAERAYIPCLENVPEYFEHMSHVTIEGLKHIYSSLERTSLLYMIKYFAGVPGYIYNEEDRLALQENLKKHLEGRSCDTGVETAALMRRSDIKDLPDRPPRLLYLHDYNTLETSPAYKNLPFIGKFNLSIMYYTLVFNSTDVGRIILNFYFKIVLFFAKYIPYNAMWKLGVKDAFVDMFEDSPRDNAVPKPNSEYNKPAAPESWYQRILAILW